ncbi:MAG TPA: hypothetical protein VF054_08135 [Micromonosporaceae bacterium]
MSNRRRQQPRPENTADTPQLLDWSTAVREIADRIADRTAYIVTTPGALIGALAERLADVPTWTAYIDNGTPLILATRNATLFGQAENISRLFGVGCAAVAVVPKTVRPALIRCAFGAHVPADGSCDLLPFVEPGEPVALPALFAAAFAQADPDAAAELFRDVPR